MTITEAAFVMVGPMSAEMTPQDKLVEQAMFAALQKAQAEGVTDPEAIKARMFAARDAITGA
jgi:hypothetical protein